MWHQPSSHPSTPPSPATHYQPPTTDALTSVPPTTSTFTTTAAACFGIKRVARLAYRQSNDVTPAGFVGSSDHTALDLNVEKRCVDQHQPTITSMARRRVPAGAGGCRGADWSEDGPAGTHRHGQRGLILPQPVNLNPTPTPTPQHRPPTTTHRRTDRRPVQVRRVPVAQASRCPRHHAQSVG